MAIAPTFQKYLAAKNVRYDIVAHEPTKSSMRTAEACRISGDRVAKAVVLRDEYGYVLAILPASHHIRLDELRTQLGLDVELAAEYEIEELFDDCLPGAIPPVGECYGLDTMVDDSIEDQPEVYLEGGDHETLVHMSHAQFASLMATARHGCFSVHY
jgi:Ala-tRNA(Pro) deacylase